MSNKIIILVIILLVVISIGGFLIYKSRSTPTACPEFEDSFYDFKEVQLGADILSTIKEGFSFIKNFIKTKLNIENFALSPGIITLDDIRGGRSTLDPNKQYFRGRRNTTSTTKPQINGGTGCPEYPDIVFKPVS
jgi:hypothetical protein